MASGTANGSLQGTITPYAEDGATPLGKDAVTMSAGQASQLVAAVDSYWLGLCLRGWAAVVYDLLEAGNWG